MKKVVLSAAICAIVFSVNAETTEVTEEVSSPIFSSIYTGIGLGGNFAKNDVNELENNRFLGAFAIGAGKQFCNGAYVGGEFLGDFAKTASASFTDTDGTAKMSITGFVPNLNFKAGYATKNDILVYGKLGVSWRKITIQVNDFKASKRKAAFVLGAGVEKSIYKKFSAALEADYDFGYNWKREFSFTTETNATKNDYFEEKGIGKSWNVRVLIKYNVKY